MAIEFREVEVSAVEVIAVCVEVVFALWAMWFLWYGASVFEYSFGGYTLIWFAVLSLVFNKSGSDYCFGALTAKQGYVLQVVLFGFVVQYIHTTQGWTPLDWLEFLAIPFAYFCLVMTGALFDGD